MKSWIIKISIFINILLYFTVVALWIILPEHLLLTVSATVFTFSLSLLFFILFRPEIKKMIELRRLKSLINMVVALFLIFSILGLLNYWSFKHSILWDTSKQKMNTLTDQSSKILHYLSGPVTFTIFARYQDALEIRSLLELYQRQKKDITIKIIDPEIHPTEIAEKNITQYGMLEVNYQKRKQFIFSADELSVTNALIRISRDKPVRLGVIVDDKTWDGVATSPQGSNQFLQTLAESSFTINDKKLFTEENWQDIDVLLLLGPKQDLNPTTQKKLDLFLSTGGRLLLALDPQWGEKNFKGWELFLKQYGIKISDAVVVQQHEADQSVDASVVITQNYNIKHPITKGLVEHIFLPLTLVVAPLPSTEVMFRVDPLIFSTEFPHSWAESDKKALLKGQANFEVGKDEKGPLVLAVAAQEVVIDQEKQEKKRTRLVVFGTSKFLQNAYWGQGQGRSLILNSLSWLAGEEELVSLNRPSATAQKIFLGTTQLRTIFYFSLLFCPLVLLSMAIFLYWRRKKM